MFFFYACYLCKHSHLLAKGLYYVQYVMDLWVSARFKSTVSEIFDFRIDTVQF